MRNWQNSYKTLKSHKLGEKKYPLMNSTQEDPSLFNRNIVDGT